MPRVPSVTDTEIVTFLNLYATALEVEPPGGLGDGWPYYKTSASGSPTLRGWVARVMARDKAARAKRRRPHRPTAEKRS